VNAPHTLGSPLLSYYGVQVGLAPPLRPLTQKGEHVQDPVLAGDAPVLSEAQMSEIVQAVAHVTTAQTHHSSTRERFPVGTFEGCLRGKAALSRDGGEAPRPQLGENMMSPPGAAGPCVCCCLVGMGPFCPWWKGGHDSLYRRLHHRLCRGTDDVRGGLEGAVVVSANTPGWCRGNARPRSRGPRSPSPPSLAAGETVILPVGGYLWCPLGEGGGQGQAGRALRVARGLVDHATS
jgi:hypothetical protein